MHLPAARWVQGVLETAPLLPTLTGHLPGLLLVVLPAQIPGQYLSCMYIQSIIIFIIDNWCTPPPPPPPNQPHNEVQDKLFSRVAKKYVELLCQPVDERWRDAFFKVISGSAKPAGYITANVYIGQYRSSVCM